MAQVKSSGHPSLSDGDFGRFPSLSEAEAARRLKTDGFNELPFSRHRGIFSLAADVLREPMFILLISAGIIYLSLGDIREALLLLASIFIIIAITFYQERKTERALEALRDLSSPRALVIRGGWLKQVPAREVVRGDTLILSEGDRIPADAVILDTKNLSCNESLLTGESVPVRKTTWDGLLSFSRPGGEDLPFVYAGTLVTAGRALAQVRAVAAATEMGKIGKSLETVRQEKSLLQKEVKSLVVKFALIGFLLCFAVFIVYGITVKSWLDGLLAGLALAMSLVPEEFPVILTVFLALGAWRMSKKHVLTRRIPVVETLGATTVLCVDKTGTLTENQMRVKKLYVSGKFFEVPSETVGAAIPENFHELLEYAILASRKDNFDPMEKAIQKLGANALSNSSHLHNDWLIVREYPLSSRLLAMSQVWEISDKVGYTVSAKGAPEAIMNLCRLDRRRGSAVLERADKMAAEGLRILGVARANVKGNDFPDDQYGLQYKFLGLIGLEDPLRPQIFQSISECQEAGIRVVMITGDHPVTAKKIAREININPTNAIITGEELEEISDQALQRRIGNVSIFARVVPEQKLRIVNALKARGEVVAMTGDGVNDAPALRAAHVGIAMGQRGTEVAREAADMVLLDDNFISIVRAVREGRKIYDNISKAMAYVLAIHPLISGMVLIPLLFRWPMALLPVHIVFLEMIVDPACSVVFEAEGAESNIMKRKPRNLNQPLFSQSVVIMALLQGLSMLLLGLVTYGLALSLGGSAEAARATVFISLVLANLSLILTNRSWSRSVVESLRTRNFALWVIAGSAIFVLVLVLGVPFLRELFKFELPSPSLLVLALASGLLSLVWLEGLKLWRNNRL